MNTKDNNYFSSEQIKNNWIGNLPATQKEIEETESRLGIKLPADYKEFLKIDFPRVPFPKTPKQFYDLEDLGRQLKEIHLLESEVVNQFITTYPIDGDNIVTRKITSKSPGYVPSSAIEKTGRLYINDTQYFDNIPLVAWEFYIGSYQPAQKWLKDRQGRELTFDDILHYQKIIVALTETDRIMGEIDKNNIK